jgi:hypothetical protein
MYAPASRGVEPFVPATSTSATGPFAAKKPFSGCRIEVMVDL